MLGPIKGWTEDIFMPLGGLGLFLVAFFSSTFLFVPPDIILALMCLHATGDPICIWYALICTIGSVLGGIFGYYLGYDRGRPILERYVTEDIIHQVEEAYRRFGIWAIGIAGFTPIPYNIFTFSSGILNYDVKKFIFMSALSRGARFLCVAILIMLWGQVMYDILTDSAIWLALGIVIIAIILSVMRERVIVKSSK